jgi:ketosteroid isomerase-like protein
MAATTATYARHHRWRPDPLKWLSFLLIHAQGQTAVTGTSGSNSPMSGGEKEEAVAEALIRQRVEDLVKAIRAKDIDGITSLFTPGLVSFDIVPPLRYVGADNKRRAWQEAFTAFTGPIAYEVRDLSVTTQGELAFVYSLNHVSGTMASGRIIDLWLRWTACFGRIDGDWLVVHDHVSVPVDLEHGRAVLNLTP